MATLYKRNESEAYWMRFTYKGKTYRESTGKKNHKSAQSIMEKRIAEVKGSGSFNDLFTRLLESVDKQPERQQDEIRRDFAARLLAGTSSKLLMSDAFAEYKQKPKKRNPSPTTVQRYEKDWERFTDWLGKNHPHVQYMHEVTHPMAVRYTTHLWSKGLTGRTFNKDLTLLKGIFRLLKTEAGLSENPWDNIDKQELSTVSKENLTPKQLEAVCSKAKGEVKTLFLIGIYTGLRMGDCATLKWDEVDLKAGNIERMPSKTRKQRKTIKIPIHDVLRIVLQDLQTKSIGKSEYVLPELAELYNRHPANVSSRVQQVFTDAEIKTTIERDDGRGTNKATVIYGFHSLRHSFISLCHASNVPQIAVMELVGHRRPCTTRPLRAEHRPCRCRCGRND
jgi:integrase